MVTIERFDGSSFVDISGSISDWKIDHGVSDVKIAPTATIRTTREANVSAGETLRITDGGTLMFEGGIERAPVSTTGTDKVEASSDAVRFFEDTVSITVSNPSAIDVLEAAIAESAVGNLVSLNWVGTDVSLGDEYAVTDRSCKRIFRDITDRTGRVWWTDLDGTIHVGERGARGTFASVDTATDGAEVREYDDSDTDTIINVQTVNGTAGERVTATATDATSINEFDRRAADPINVSYISSQSEAQAYADELLVPDPLARAEVNLTPSVGDLRVPIVNYSLDVTDAGGTGMNRELPIEAQTIRQGNATVALGEGAGANVAKLNRRQKSSEDVTEPGSVYGNDRIADDAIDEAKLQDESVTAAELADQAVTSDKIFPKAVIEGALGDQAVTTAKVQTSAIIADRIDDSAVETDKIANSAINGDKIQTGAVGTTKLFVADWIPVGLSFTDDDPTNGDVSWNSHELVYEGTTYNISSGSTDATYIYWFEGDGFYQASDFKPNLGPDDALVCVNDDGTANQILQATSIHGGSIVTNTVDTAELRAGAITADEIDANAITADKIDVLDLDTDQLSIGADASGGWEFDTESFGGDTVATMVPFGDGALIGTDFDRPDAFFDTITATGDVVLDGFDPDLDPGSDDTGSVGDANRAWSEMTAYEFIDADDGTITPDGGDPLAGVAEGHGPPDTCEVCDEDGETKGYSINRMTREAWDVIREQARRISDLEDRLAALEGDNA